MFSFRNCLFLWKYSVLNLLLLNFGSNFLQIVTIFVFNVYYERHELD